jgi:hypothetical protein
MVFGFVPRQLKSVPLVSRWAVPGFADGVIEAPTDLVKEQLMRCRPEEILAMIVLPIISLRNKNLKRW